MSVCVCVFLFVRAYVTHTHTYVIKVGVRCVFRQASTRLTITTNTGMTTTDGETIFINLTLSLSYAGLTFD